MNPYEFPIGHSREQVFQVSIADTIAEIDPRLPAVLATYVGIRWMETVAGLLVQDFLPPDVVSVGTEVQVKHTGMVPVGERVQVQARIVQAEGRNIELQIEVQHQQKVVMAGIHRRTVLPLRVIERQLSRGS